MQTLAEAEVQANTTIEEYQQRQTDLMRWADEIATLGERKKLLGRGHRDAKGLAAAIRRRKKLMKENKISVEDRVRYAEAIRFLRGINSLPINGEEIVSRIHGGKRVAL